MKKILLYFSFNTTLKDWYRLGILERELHYYRLLYKEYKFKVTLITYGTEEDIKINPFKDEIKVIPLRNYISFSKFKFLFFLQSIFFIPIKVHRIIKDYDIVKTQQMSGSWATWIHKIIYKKKIIIRCGYELYEHHKLLGSSKFKRLSVFLVSLFSYWIANKVIITTDLSKKFILNNFFLKDKKIFVIPNFVDEKIFFDKNHIRSKNTILSVGRLEPEKNYKKLIYKLKKSNFDLLLIGKGSQKKELENYAKLLSTNLKIIDNIKNSELNDYYNKYKFFLLPSIKEGHPKVLIEAMTSGMIVIGSNVTGINNVIKSGLNGILINQSLDNLLSILDELLIDQNKSDFIINNAKKLCLKNYSIKNIINLEIKCLSNV